jgi:hypothetical protein
MTLESKTSHPLIEARTQRINRLIQASQLSLHSAQAQRQLLLSPTEEINVYLQKLALKKTRALIASIEENLRQYQQTLEIIRPPREEDLSYRRELLAKLPILIKQLTRLNPSIRDLRFHGASYLTSLKIIESQKIVSAQERNLDRTSFDATGQISVSTPESIIISLRDYLDIKDHLIPLGCLFVVIPEDDINVASGRSSLMKSLKLARGGEPSNRFIGVLCTPETISAIKAALEKSGFAANLALDFFDLLPLLARAKQSLGSDSEP